MKTNASRKESGTPIYCYVILIALTAILCTYFFAKALHYNNYTIIDNGIEMKLPSDSTDPAEVLSEAGITLSAGDSYSVGANDTITILHDDAVSAENASMQAASESSTASGITVDTEIASAVKSESTTNSTRYDTEIVDVPYDTVTLLDPSMTEGTTKVQTEGINGQNQVTTCTTIVNGKEVSSKIVSTVTLTEPVDEVILSGSAAVCNESDTAVASEADAEVIESDEQTEPAEEEPAAAETIAASDSAAAAATASAEGAEEPAEEEPAEVPVVEEEPEEEPEPEPVYDEPSSVSGNTITTSDGTVLTYSDVLYVTATAYTGGGITATGTTARYGEIAVDPSVIPYGTEMYIMTEDGEWIYGYATAEDCGGAIKGNIIDLYFDSYDTCCQFGRRSCIVYILD